jgi:hypothetical protein
LALLSYYICYGNHITISESDKEIEHLFRSKREGAAIKEIPIKTEAAALKDNRVREFLKRRDLLLTQKLLVLYEDQVQRTKRKVASEEQRKYVE